MEVIETSIEEVKIIIPKYFEDNRGYFAETYSKRDFEEIGINMNFIQDNHSMNLKKDTIRGIHFQNSPKAQSKIIRCVSGAIMDYAVDLRKNSKTYKKFVKVLLSKDNRKQLFMPKGFGHLYHVLEDNTEVLYKCDEFYFKDYDRTIKFNDREIALDLNVKNPILSEKDRNAVSLLESDVNFTLENC